MCPFCYVPFIAAITTFLISFFGFEATHEMELYVSWGVSVVISIGVFYLAKWLYRWYKS